MVVLLLVFEDFFDPAEFFGGGEAADGGVVDGGLGAEAGVVGGGLEFVDEGAEVALLVESGGEGLHGVGLGWGFGGRGGECAVEEAGQKRHGWLGLWWWWWRGVEMGGGGGLVGLWWVEAIRWRKEMRLVAANCKGLLYSVEVLQGFRALGGTRGWDLLAGWDSICVVLLVQNGVVLIQGYITFII